MITMRKIVIAFCIVLIGICAAPLLPFPALIVFPVLLLVVGMPILALLLSILLSSFLVPEGAPFWLLLPFYIVLIMPIYQYIRHNMTV